MPTYTLQIVVDGKDRASKPLGNVSNALGNIGQIAAGILTSRLLMRIGEGLNNIVTGAINSAAALQLQGLALETLVGRELMQGQEIENTVTKVVHLTAKEKERLESLRTDYDLLGARIQETMQKIWERENVWTEKPVLQLNTLKATLADMQERYGDLGGEMEKLEKKEGSLVQVQETMRVNTMDLGEALKQAGPKAGELLKQLRDLSLISPFQYEQIFATYRLQLAYGATTEQAMDLTKAVLDTGAALGLDNTVMERLNYNLTQAVVAGDLTAINLRQLKLAGLNLADVFESELSMSVEEVRTALDNSKLTMEDVGQAFTDYAQKYFGGAAERMTRTFHGLRENVKDLFFFGGADTLTPLIEKLTDVMNTAFDKAREFMEEGKLAEFGEELGTAFTTALDALSPFGQAIKELFQGDTSEAIANVAAGIGDMGVALGLWDTDKGHDITTAIYEIGTGALIFGEATAKFFNTLADAAWQASLAWIEEHGAEVTANLATITENLGILFWKIIDDGEGAGKIMTEIVNVAFGEFLVLTEGLAEASGLLVESIEDLGELFGDLGDGINKVDPVVLDAIMAAINRIIKPFSSAKKETEGLQKAFGWLTEKSNALVTAIEKWSVEAWTNITVWFQAAADAAGALVSAIERLIQAAARLAGIDWGPLQGHSPPPLANWMNDIATTTAAAQIAMDSFGRAVPSFAGGGLLANQPFGGATATNWMNNMAATTAMAHSAMDSFGGTTAGGSSTYNVYINDRAAASFFLAQIEQQKTRRANAFMGG